MNPLKFIWQTFKVSAFLCTRARLVGRNLLDAYLPILKSTLMNEADNLDCVIHWNDDSIFMSVTIDDDKFMDFAMGLIKDPMIWRNFMFSTECSFDFILEHRQSSEKFKGNVRFSGAPYRHDVKIELEGEETEQLIVGPIEMAFYSPKHLTAHLKDIAENTFVVFALHMLDHPDNRVAASAVRAVPQHHPYYRTRVTEAPGNMPRFA